MTASKQLLEQLHEIVGQQLLERISSGEATAAEFGQAIKFLQANGIEAIPTGNNALDQLGKTLTSKLPFTDPNDITYN